MIRFFVSVVGHPGCEGFDTVDSANKIARRLRARGYRVLVEAREVAR